MIIDKKDYTYIDEKSRINRMMSNFNKEAERQGIKEYFLKNNIASFPHLYRKGFIFDEQIEQIYYNEDTDTFSFCLLGIPKGVFEKIKSIFIEIDDKWKIDTKQVVKKR